MTHGHGTSELISSKTEGCKSWRFPEAWRKSIFSSDHTFLFRSGLCSSMAGGHTWGWPLTWLLNDHVSALSIWWLIRLARFRGKKSKYWKRPSSGGRSKSLITTLYANPQSWDKSSKGQSYKRLSWLALPCDLTITLGTLIHVIKGGLPSRNWWI